MLTSKFKRAQVTPNYLTLLIKTCHRMYGFLGSNTIFWEITTEPDRPRIQRYARQLILAPMVLRLRRSWFGTPSMKENYSCGTVTMALQYLFDGDNKITSSSADKKKKGKSTQILNVECLMKCVEIYLEFDKIASALSDTFR